MDSELLACDGFGREWHCCLTLAFDISQGSGISVWQGVVQTLRSLELLRDAEPGGRYTRAPQL